jgi:muconate/chloromuconate cycloisomerase
VTDLRIAAIDTQVVDIPFRRPHRFAGTSIDCQSYLIVRLRTDAGYVGVGEGITPGGPWWSGESIEGQQLMIDSYFTPVLLGADCLDPHGALAALDRVAYANDFAKAAVEMALLDAAAQARNVPVHVLAGGGAARDQIPVRWALSGLGGTEVAQEATERLRQGHQSIKFKAGALSPAEDLKRIATLVDKIGDDVDYLVDPNGVWDFRTAAWAIQELEAIGIGMLEQPLRRDDLAGMAELRRRATTIRIVADESVSRPGDALAAASARACDAVAIKPGKAGGLTRAAQVAAVTTAAGLACYGGSALETSIGTAAAAHLFAALPELTLGCELAGPLLLADDLVTNPVQYADGNLQVPEGPGLGVAVNWDNVDRYARRPT